MKWTKTVRERLAIYVFGKGPRGSIDWFDKAVARPAAKRVIQRAGRR
jgi:hypothetical protein